MFTKIALNRRLNRKTVAHVHRHLLDLGQGVRRMFWIRDRA